MLEEDELRERNDLILVIDDDDTDRMFTARSIRVAAPNLRIVLCENGIEGHAKIKAMFEGEEKASLVLMDQKMPGQTGLDILQALNAADQAQNIPIILFSSAVAPSVVDSILESGAKAFITKPVAPEEYQQAIRQALQEHLPVRV